VRNGVTKQLDLAGHVVINNTVVLTGQQALTVQQWQPVMSH
jgi:acyl-[acyl carrier protein]--UDP-N-acetylglucosamine O-acyltransferase